MMLSALSIADATKSFYVADGPSGIIETLRAMAEIVRSYRTNIVIRELASRIVHICPGKDEACELEQIQDWVRGNIRYQRDINMVETLQAPDYTVNVQYGDCDDHSILVATMLETLGFPTAFDAIGYERGKYEHVFTVAYTGGQWVSVETTEDFPVGWEPPTPVEYYRQFVE